MRWNSWYVTDRTREVGVSYAHEAEQEMITIIPQFTLKENSGHLNGISGDFGPFDPAIPAQVPLWLAIALKQIQKCRILQPSWFTVGHLKDRLEQETTSELFEELPFHYLEIAALLIKHASDDMEQVETLRLLLEDIQQVRQDKIRNGLVRIATDVQTGGSAYAVQLNHVAAMEINSVRQFMTKSLLKFYGLGAARTADDGDSQRPPSSQASDMSSAPDQALRRFRGRN
ncbi:Aste57867_14871 [Aphanomyces stellatus]|uniref:DNA replication complex GINS protein PSF2 n=1 Tax=Aphanomyces stellatus TaxID=120398 RepID=A0A485L4G1_9STRA|nr:hypothetical protein As57867_014815 [Aphanomyces stellatus]VFT91688.1 Aste57867_14871 [Aphanomyces stellatus]